MSHKLLAIVYLVRYTAAMSDRLHAIPLEFWKSAAGNEPVRDWLKELPVADRVVVGGDLRQVQFGWPIGMPLVRHLQDGLWEVRSSLPSKREARVIFTANDEVIIALHSFIKKSRKTPPSDLALATKRRKDITK